MSGPITAAGRGHDGLLVASCACGWGTTADSGRSALVQLLEHQREAHPTTTEET